MTRFFNFIIYKVFINSFWGYKLVDIRVIKGTTLVHTANSSILPKTRWRFLHVFLLVNLLIISACNNAEKTSNKNTSDSLLKPVQSMNDLDTRFLLNAAEISLEEMRLSDLAQQKTQSKEVRELAQMLVLEHGNTLNSITEIAQKNNIIIPSSASDKAIASFELLNKNTGKLFDIAYCELMAQEHKTSILSFEKEINETSNDEIRTWAKTTLLTLKIHLEHIETCIQICNKM